MKRETAGATSGYSPVRITYPNATLAAIMKRKPMTLIIASMNHKISQALSLHFYHLKLQSHEIKKPRVARMPHASV